MMDIVVVPAKNKIMTMPRPGLGDETYYNQKTFMDSLARTGVFGLNTIQGGILRGVLEGTLTQSLEGILARTSGTV